MAKKYHISKKGEVAECLAKEAPCPLGGEHFLTKKAANEFLTDKNKKEFGILGTPQEDKYSKSDRREIELGYLCESEDRYAFTRKADSTLKKSLFNQFDMGSQGIRENSIDIEMVEVIGNETLWQLTGRVDDDEGKAFFAYSDKEDKWKNVGFKPW